MLYYSFKKSTIPWIALLESPINVVLKLNTEVYSFLSIILILLSFGSLREIE
jgi:hypothetical protein